MGHLWWLVIVTKTHGFSPEVLTTWSYSSLVDPVQRRVKSVILRSRGWVEGPVKDLGSRGPGPPS